MESNIYIYINNGTFWIIEEKESLLNGTKDNGVEFESF